MTKPLLLLIYPAPDKDRLGLRRRSKSSVAQLGMPLLAAYADDRFEVRIVDESVENLDLSIQPDLVGITIMTSTALRGYQIADTLRTKGIPVVFGGMHASFMPDETLTHADAVLIREAEFTWDNLLDDFLAGQMEKIYSTDKLHTLQGLPKPRLDLLKKGAYSFPNIVETARGCPHHCHYCSVTQYWGNTFRFRPIEEVIEEMKLLPPGHIIFIDDNIYGHPNRAKELFKAMIPLKRRWSGQGDLRLARDEELLNLAVRSGCTWIFVGMESIDAVNLKAMGKLKLNRSGEYTKAISTIQRAGINLFASFMFGMDNDDLTVFDRTVEFAIQNRVAGANFYILTPLPGTRFYKDIESEGRLLHKKWNLYDSNHVVFQPMKMSPAQLREGYIGAYKKYYSYASIAQRMLRKHTSLLQFLSLNMGRHLNFRHFKSGCEI